MIKILDAAKYFVFLSYQDKALSLTPLKLQKLLYFAQGWSFVWDEKALFQEEFEAWQYGPVNSEVYHYFSRYGRDEIPLEEGIVFTGHQEEKETIEAVWQRYGEYSAFELVEMTHKQTPWLKAYSNDAYISNKDICEYFQSTY